MKPIPFLFRSDVTPVAKSKVNETVKKGDVILVRSDYAYQKYRDHFSLIVGGHIQKDRGLRPNLVTLPPTDQYDYLLNAFPVTDGATILKLSPEKAAEVMDYYGLHLSEGELIN